MSRQTQQQGRRWYALHTYSGYEDNVVRNLKQRVVSMDMQEKIFDVLVPTETRFKIKGGKRSKVREKIFPGYVLVNMVVTDESWYVVRNTPNITGFIGTGTTPSPVSEEEIKYLQKRMGIEEPKYQIDVTVGTPVKIVDGPFKEYEGKISQIDDARGKVKVLVSMFGRETPVELDFLQIKKL